MTALTSRGVGVAAWSTLVAAVVLGTDLVLPTRTPAGIVLLGLTIGALNAMLAIGLILVYRTSRIINFSHGEVGAFAAILSVELYLGTGWHYLVAALAGVLVAALAAGLVEVLVIRRFRQAPRLIVTVVTIGVAQFFVFLELFIPQLIPGQTNSGTFRTPLSDVRFSVDPVIFDGNYLLVLVVGAIVVLGLSTFFRTRFGVGVRAAADNLDRAALVGIPTATLTTVVWVIAGALSGMAALLQGPVVGLQIGVLIGPGLLLRALAAAVIGRMRSLPFTALAALGLGVLEQAIFWSFGRSQAIDAALLVVILGGLLLQRRGSARVDDEESGSWEAVEQVRPIPQELRRLPEVRWGRVGLGAALALVVLVGPALLSQAQQNLSAVIVIYGLIGVSLVVLTGWAGQVSLGQFALVGIGAALAGSASAEAGWDFFLTMLVGGGAGLVAALVLGLPALRLRGFFLAVTTLAFAVTTSSFLLQIDWLVPDLAVNRPVLFGAIDLEAELSYYYVCLAVLVVAIAAVRGLRVSRMGRAIISVRDNQRAAQSYGVNAMLAKLVAFGISGFIAGVAGALLVHQQHGLPPSQYAPGQSFAVFLLAVVGGLGSIPGALLGAIYIKGAQHLLQGPAVFLATGPGVVAMLLFLPGGLGSLLYRIRDAALRRIARRRGLVVPSLLADVAHDRATPPVKPAPEVSELMAVVP